MLHKIQKLSNKGISDIARIIGDNDIKNLRLYADKNTEYFEFFPSIVKLLNLVKNCHVSLINFPFCVLSENNRDHIIIDKKNAGQKIKECSLCLYKKICPGFPVGYFKKHGVKEVTPVPDLPSEVMIEIEPRCNFNCRYCYNKKSFAREGRAVENLSQSLVKKVIDQVVKAGIKNLRFTGGEPMLRSDIFELLEYAKAKSINNNLNTNCSLINKKNINKLKGILDVVLIPIESYLGKKEDQLAGYENALERKLTAIKLFKSIKIPIVRVGTVITKDNIKHFNSLADFILSLPIDEWDLYRPISNDESSPNLETKEINKLIKHISLRRKKTKIRIAIANSFPFCAAADINKINEVCIGALFDDGHSRLVIDPRGFVKPHYFIDKNIGDPLDIIKAWQHPFMKKMRNLGFLPGECQDCIFKFKCRGGSRFEAKQFYGSYDAPDPLANSKLVSR